MLASNLPLGVERDLTSFVIEQHPLDDFSFELWKTNRWYCDVAYVLHPKKNEKGRKKMESVAKALACLLISTFKTQFLINYRFSDIKSEQSFGKNKPPHLLNAMHCHGAG